jgi:tRNA dimethylallyltransferase
MSFLKKQIAFIGSTASGKSALALKYAKRFGANILSLDSLAIYKEIDIVSAKPTLKERDGILHFGIDEIYPNEHFDVTLFINLYNRARRESIKEGRELVIVGGTSFYLYILLNGISPLPKISDRSRELVRDYLKDLNKAYSFLYSIDRDYMQNIKPTDRYRLEKALELYFETSIIPSRYFALNPPEPIIRDNIEIYEIDINRDILRERIEIRTEQMFSRGLVDEVKYLENRYTREPNCMKAIGIREILRYFDGEFSLEEAKEKIIINTARLAKRQRTFNRSKFKNRRELLDLEQIESKLFS